MPSSAPSLVERLDQMDKLLEHILTQFESQAEPAVYETRGLVWYIASTATTGTNKAAQITYRGPTALIYYADATCKTAPTGSALIFDIHVNGTSIWAFNQSNRLQIAASGTSGAQTSFDTTLLNDGDVLTLDIDQVGSTVAGAYPTVTLSVKPLCNGTFATSYRQAIWYLPSSSLSTGSDQSAQFIYRGPDAEIVRADATVKTAPIGSALIFDIQRAGSSIWGTNPSNRLTIADGQTSGTQNTFDLTSISSGAALKLDIDQVGSSTPGGYATVALTLACPTEEA